MIDRFRARMPRGALAAVLAATGLVAAQWSGPVAGPAPRAHPAAASAPLTLAQAEARAAATGTAVVADALTTETAQTTVNPDGTVTLTEAVGPVRVWQKGAWTGLDATLHRNSDGTLSPNATPSALVLSGGGNAPLAVMTLGGRQLSITLPISLPTPTVSGASATYANVLPDTDLVVTATDQGGYSDVIVAKNAAAAANPQLTDLLTATTASSGLSVAADQAGNITASDSAGHPVFTAPAPAMWDSTTAPRATPTPSPSTTAAAAASAPTAGTDPVSGLPLTSSVAGPGEHANTAALHATYTAGALKLTPSASLLTATTTTYPVYFDPSVAPALSNWTMVNSNFPTTSYYNSGTGGEMQVGFNSWSAPYFTARSFATLALPSVLTGATIQSASVIFFENVAPSCTAEEVDLYTTGSIGNTTTWDHQPSWNSQIGAKSAAHGYTGCIQGGIEFDITGAVASALTGGGQNLTLGLKTPSSTEGTPSSGYNSGGNGAYWKQFIGKDTTASITYNHPPIAPTLGTGPATNCQNQILGDTGVNLIADPSDPDGGSLTTAFDLWKDADPSQANQLTAANGVNSDQISGSSGQPATLVLPETFFKSLAGNTLTTFDFKAESTDTDGPATGPWSTTCTFSWDPTRPGAPGVATNASPPAGAESCATTITGSAGTPQPLGSTCSFTLTPPNGATISGYLYQVNQEPPVTVAASGSTSINVPLTRLVNTLSVDALSAGGNIGSPAPLVTFDGTALNPPAKDGDLDNNGTPDLIVPGAPGSAFPPGLWFASGHADGTLTPTAANIGINGLGYTPTPTATDWNGAQAITGNFCGNGVQDVLGYYPTGTNASGAAIVCNDASSNPLHLTNPLTSDPIYRLAAPTFQDASGNNATQVANAGNTSGAGKARPDLLAIINNQLYLFDSSTATGYSNDGGFGCFQNCDQLTALNTPDGTQDWNSWTITTAQDTRNNATVTDMYLWNSSTGALYLWAAVTIDTSNNTSFPNATTLTYTPYTLHTGTGTDTWNKGATTLQLRAADFNGSGIPDLWATTLSTGSTTAYLPSALANDPSVTTATTNVSTAAHAWPLQDIGSNTPGSTATTSTDIVSGLNLTGTSGATWYTGDLYSPDIALDGASGYLATASAAVTPNADFTLCAWVKPTADGGTVLSQDGTDDSAFTVSLTPGGQWQIGMNNNATTTASYDTATGTAATLDAWTQLTLSYTAASKTLALYTDNTLSAALTATAPPTATGPLRLGANQTANAPAGFYTGQIANVQTWNSVQTPPITPALGTLGDVTGDGKPDIVAIDSAGNLWLYPNTGATGTATLGTRTQVGTGWTGFTLDAVTHLYPTDPTNRAGLLATDPHGNLYYYANTGGTGLSTFAAPVQVGSGWAPMTVLGVTDLFSTGSPGLLAINATDHNLYYYPNAGGTGLSTFAAPDEVGTGWIGLTAVVGTVNNDTKPDILALDTNGNLWLYPNIGGTGAPGSPDPTFGTQTQVGTGLTGDQLVALSDLYATGRNGYITVDTNGNLYYTPNTGGTGLNTFGTPTLIDTGWSGYTIN